MVLQNAFPATLVFSQLSALPRRVSLVAPSLSPRRPLIRWPKSRNSRPYSGLLPLYLSCLSFAEALRLFSIVCRLFLQNTGGGVSLIPETLRNSVLFTYFVAFLRDAPARYILRASFTRGFHD